MSELAEKDFKDYNIRFRDFMVQARLTQMESHMDVVTQSVKDATQRLGRGIV